MITAFNGTPFGFFQTFHSPVHCFHLSDRREFLLGISGKGLVIFFAPKPFKNGDLPEGYVRK